MSDSTDGINILVIADPGLPTRRMRKVADSLRSELEAAFAPPVELYVQTETIRVRTDNTIDAETARRRADDYERVDATVLLTEMPRHSGGHALVAEILPDEHLGIISCPTLGLLFPKKRLQSLIITCVEQSLPEQRRGRLQLNENHWSEWDTADGGDRKVLRAHTFTGMPRTVIGMVLANDPWRTAPKLSSALAAAAAVGAFGIFYSSIWQMSAALSTARLLLIGLLAIGSMVLWLISSNKLWDKPVNERLSSVVLLYNLSTVTTMFLATAVLYFALVILILLGGLVVIDPGFMAETIGADVGFVNYLDIAWFSAAMGVVAGGLGSSFDSSTNLRQLTHGQRERQRQLTTDDDQEDAGQ